MRAWQTSCGIAIVSGWLCTAAAWGADPPAGEAAAAAEAGSFAAARLVYGEGQSSICFAEAFLRDTAELTHLRPAPRLDPVPAEALDPRTHPFTVMTGEGGFTLTDEQSTALRGYLDGGGFLLASAGCSSPTWNRDFAAAARELVPGAEERWQTLEAGHPVYHTVFDIPSSRYRVGGARLPELRVLRRGGRIAVVWSPDGLNDSARAEDDDDCCCCGGNEVRSARQVNVNLLVYAMTH
jgi:hypothetical protein